MERLGRSGMSGWIIAATALASSVVVMGIALPALAQNGNSLWIGTDNTSGRNALNVTRSGGLLRTVGPVEVTGFAIDVNAGVIYFANSLGGITRRDLVTLSTGTSFGGGGSEDMTFDGQFIWRAGAPGPAASTVLRKIDPVTQASSNGFSIPFPTVGIAWDGSGFWIDQFTTNGLVQRFDATGNATGESFHTTGNFINGGLAYDPTDNTLYIGTFGKVYHYSRTGTQLGFFDIPAGQDPGRFVDGLEFEATPGWTEVPGSGTGSKRVLSLRPTPTRGVATFLIDASGPVRLRIYDMAGRMVRELADRGNGPARTLHWDGQTEGGHRVSAGAYIVRLESADGLIATARLTLLR